MDVRVRRGDIAGRAVGALILGVLEGTRRPSGALARVDAATRGAVSGFLKTGDFSGAPSTTAVLYARGLKAKRLILVGLGALANLDLRAVRNASAAAVRRARDLGAGAAATVIHGAGKGGLPIAAAAQAVAEGA